MGKVSMPYLFSFPRYETKCVIKFLFRQLMMSNYKIYVESTSKAMADREKKRGRQEYKNLNISRMKRAFKMK